MKNDKIVISIKLRKRSLAAGHDGHQGIVKTKMLLQSKVWYPGMDKDINEYVSNCRGCQLSINDNSREPLIMTELPKPPWESVSTDFYGPLPSGEYLISVNDDYSRFPVVNIVRSTSPRSSVPVYEIFSEFGIPKKVRSDNGSPFNSKEFRDFAAFLGFENKTVTPYYPQANGMVEKFNTMLGNIIKSSKALGKNWKQEMQRFLQNYRSTPHTTTGKSPAHVLFSHRNFRIRIPELTTALPDEDFRKTDYRNKMKIKKYVE